MHTSPAFLLKKRLSVACAEFLEHQELFDALTESIKNKELIIVWTTKVEVWEKDPSLEDPYEVVMSGTLLLRYTATAAILISSN